MSPSVVCAKDKLGHGDVGSEIDATDGSSSDEEEVVPVAPRCALFACEYVASEQYADDDAMMDKRELFI